MISSYAGTCAATNAAHDLRSDVYDKIATFSSREHQDFGTPTLITRSTDGVQQIQALLLTFGTFESLSALRRRVGVRVLRHRAVAAHAGSVGSVLLRSGQAGPLNGPCEDQTRLFNRAVTWPPPPALHRGHEIREEDVARLSPIKDRQINFLGRYLFNIKASGPGPACALF
ncbi:hypothetical protein AB5J49_00640 [Streptomyces sp. R28]|uniref:ABC transmembrane type-1 domain-containing protein n=1 Tax=Streptomyces sp. R28 TaxID=3238628 RepID=A0AB39PNK9_9ACTN